PPFVPREGRFDQFSLEALEFGVGGFLGALHQRRVTDYIGSQNCRQSPLNSRLCHTASEKRIDHVDRPTTTLAPFATRGHSQQPGSRRMQNVAWQMLCARKMAVCHFPRIQRASEAGDVRFAPNAPTRASPGALRLAVDSGR